MKRHWIRYLPEWCRTMASQANQSLHRWGNTWLSPQVTLMVHVGPDPGIVDDWMLCFPDIWSSNLFRTQSNIFHLSVSSTLQEFAVWNLKLPPYPEGKERLKRERDQSRLASSRFNKQADLHLRLVFSSIQFSSVSHSCPMLCDPMDSSTSGLPVHPSIRVFSNESALHIRWSKYWSFSFSISLSNEYSGWISFWMDWLDILAVQGNLKNLLQHRSSKTATLQCSALFIVQLSHPYMTLGKTKLWLDGLLSAKNVSAL